MAKLTPDISCKALKELNKILLLQESEQNNDGFSYGPFNDKFGQLVSKMQRYCERYDSKRQSSRSQPELVFALTRILVINHNKK